MAITPLDLALAAGAGTIIGPLLLVIVVSLVQLWDFRGWIKDDVPRRRQAWLYVTVGPKHVYYQTDWGTIGKFGGVVAVVGLIASPTAIIFAVGVAEIFL